MTSSLTIIPNTVPSSGPPPLILSSANSAAFVKLLTGQNTRVDVLAHRFSSYQERFRLCRRKPLFPRSWVCFGTIAGTVATVAAAWFIWKQAKLLRTQNQLQTYAATFKTGDRNLRNTCLPIGP